jgi:hypothetical protein
MLRFSQLSAPALLRSFCELATSRYSSWACARLGFQTQRLATFGSTLRFILLTTAVTCRSCFGILSCRLLLLTLESSDMTPRANLQRIGKDRSARTDVDWNEWVGERSVLAIRLAPWETGVPGPGARSVQSCPQSYSASRFSHGVNGTSPGPPGQPLVSFAFRGPPPARARSPGRSRRSPGRQVTTPTRCAGRNRESSRNCSARSGAAGPWPPSRRFRGHPHQ